MNPYYSLRVTTFSSVFTFFFVFAYASNLGMRLFWVWVRENDRKRRVFRSGLGFGFFWTWDCLDLGLLDKMTGEGEGRLLGWWGGDEESG